MDTLIISMETSNNCKRNEAIDNDSPYQIGAELRAMNSFLIQSINDVKNSKDYNGFNFQWRVTRYTKGNTLCKFTVKYEKDNGNWYATLEIDNNSVWTARNEYLTEFKRILSFSVSEIDALITFRIAKSCYCIYDK